MKNRTKKIPKAKTSHLFTVQANCPSCGSFKVEMEVNTGICCTCGTHFVLMMDVSPEGKIRLSTRENIEMFFE